MPDNINWFHSSLPSSKVSENLIIKYKSHFGISWYAQFNILDGRIMFLPVYVFSPKLINFSKDKTFLPSCVWGKQPGANSGEKLKLNYFNQKFHENKVGGISTFEFTSEFAKSVFKHITHFRTVHTDSALWTIHALKKRKWFPNSSETVCLHIISDLFELYTSNKWSGSETLLKNLQLFKDII